MSAFDDLVAHLETGTSTVCRCWDLLRKDGARFFFTDHDQPITIDGVTYKAESGMTAQALEQRTGLAVDNTEAIGVLSDAGVREEDIEAGRFDGAEVRVWMVNWANPAERALRFRGTIGEVERQGGAFRAELRGLSEMLNRPKGLVFQTQCSAVLGDARCGVDLAKPGMTADVAVLEVRDRRILSFPELPAFDAGWFRRGRVEVLSGSAAALTATVKADRQTPTGREIELWEEIRAPIGTGDLVRLVAGCDRSPETCRVKFGNFLNFRGFPHIPGEDWQMAYPTRQKKNDGGSLNE